MYSMRYKAYRYRLYPNKEQQELINKHIGCCRYIYNYGLEKKIKAYQECKKKQLAVLTSKENYQC